MSIPSGVNCKCSSKYESELKIIPNYANSLGLGYGLDFPQSGCCYGKTSQLGVQIVQVTLENQRNYSTMVQLFSLS